MGPFAQLAGLERILPFGTPSSSGPALRETHGVLEHPRTRGVLLFMYRHGWLRRNFAQNLVQLNRSNRLGQVSIHADAKVSLAVPFHGIRGHGLNGHVKTAFLFLLSNLYGCFDSAHYWHLHIH
jgi:hypothetical protein